jgi:hypothetical protein
MNELFVPKIDELSSFRGRGGDRLAYPNNTNLKK